MTTTTIKVAAAKTQHISVKSVIFDPQDNYRWGSKEAMEHDIATSVTEDDDGQKVNAYRVIVNSIKATGHVQVPIGVRAIGKKFKMVYGFNRFLAAREIGLSTVPAVVYPNDTDEGTLATLQVVENSDSLKRTVNWVAETRMWEKLYNLTHDQMMNVLPSRRPKTTSGAPLSASCAAWRDVASKIGRSELTMRERIQILNCLDAEVQQIAHRKNWSFNATKEFYSGDARKPYVASFVKHLLDEIKRSDPDFDHVTPATVTKAKVRVARWLAAGRGKDGKPLWRGKGSDETDEQPALTEADGLLRLSPAGMRDIAINLATDSLRKLRLTLSQSETQWAAVEKTQTWHRVIGVGVGSGSVRMREGSEDLTENVDFTDLPARAQTFVMGVFVSAALRCEIETRCRVNWSEWYSSNTIVGVDSRSNRILFRSLVQTNSAREGTLRSRAQAAWRELEASGMLPILRA